MIKHGSRRWTIFWGLLAAAALIAVGGVQARQGYLTRGLPASLPEPVNAGGPRWGINVELEQYTTAERAAVLDDIQATGINNLKQSFYYSPDFDWAAADALVEAVTQRQLALTPLLDGSPEDNFAPPTDPNTFAAWAGAFAARYGDSIRHYIIWDEPNLASHWGRQPVNPAEYAALLSAASTAVRAADTDALIIAAPLAPTVETGPANLSETLFLQGLYEAGAAPTFDIVAGKPYGFDSSPEDRTVRADTLNFSRIILLREVMVRHGDGHKALWAGNWGWNSLPDGWNGAPSIWGEIDEPTRAQWTTGAWERARREWPWLGVMFLENWQPAVPADDPRWGFSIAGRPTAAAIQAAPASIAYPGFHLAQNDNPAQEFSGGWRFSPDFGADISQSGDAAVFHFWGTEVGLRVRRADFRARLHITVDGRPANALPHDEHGAVLVLTSADPSEDYIVTELVAQDLPPGEHTLRLVASRGWDQWALHGFSAGYRPPPTTYRLTMAGLLLTAVLSLLLAVRSGRQADWSDSRFLTWLHNLTPYWQLGLTAVTAGLVALTGWLTWGAQAAGAYRRLGDGVQLALTAATAGIFYATPSFLFYIAALALFGLLIYLRPSWGLATIAFSLPFYVQPKPMLGYQFSPVEVFILTTLAAFLLRRLSEWRTHRAAPAAARPGSSQTGRFSTWQAADIAVLALTLIATLSLFYTKRLDLATNEWRVVIVEPALFYLLLRWSRPDRREMARILDGFVLGGVVVALIGLGQLVTGQNLITAEGGLLRLRSIYGSPNNVALYLGRILPLLAAVALMGQGRRRLFYGLALLITGLTVLLTFSKGALFLGLPAAGVIVFVLWQRSGGRRIWPWLLGAAGLGALALIVALQIPALAARLNPQGATGVFRLNLWQSSLNMFRENPWFGVGLDNFLYAYRGRYILDAAWQEPNLNHPHNLVLDFATRLGLFGLLAGAALLYTLGRIVWKLNRQHFNRLPANWQPVAVGLAGALANIVAHGLVDHSFFLVDLAGAFYLLLATAVWLKIQLPNSQG